LQQQKQQQKTATKSSNLNCFIADHAETARKQRGYCGGLSALFPPDPHTPRAAVACFCFEKEKLLSKSIG
jgi:hypothetical protein